MQASPSPLPVACGDFLLPGQGVDMRLWPVVACDQYTAQPEYWERADALAGASPSALRLILPEAYLGAGDEARIARAQKAMRAYLRAGVFSPAFRGMALVERVTQSGARVGLVLTVDLEQYDFEPGAMAAVRPTEGTVRERIPPRLRLRQNADLELSHVLLLLDDPQNTVIEPLYARRDTLAPLYDTELMLGGGHARGWAVPEGAQAAQAFAALEMLRVSLAPGAPLIAVGDGNHSLATARAHWLHVRDGLSPEQRERHPARFAMAELENLHCPALLFEPIHRFVFGKSARDLLALLAPASPRAVKDQPDAVLMDAGEEIAVRFDMPLHPLPVGTVQQLLDAQPANKIDYIHGADAARALAQAGKGAAILLPAMDKGALFPAIAQGGVLPRKTFSMGEAWEKRYYIEARCIR